MHDPSTESGDGPTPAGTAEATFAEPTLAEPTLAEPTPPQAAREPELPAHTEPIPAPARERGRLGWLPWLSVLGAVGLLAIAASYAAVGAGETAAQALFWVGIVVMAAPIGLRLIRPSPQLGERIGLVVVLAVLLDLVHVLRSPVAFTDYDELLHLRTLQDILASHHLFAANPLLDVSPLYPGLEIATSAISQLAGAAPFASGVLLLLATHVLLALGLFGLYREASSSDRVGGVATAIYLLNPNAVFFDAQYAYESLALALVPAVLLLAARLAERTSSPRDPEWSPRTIDGSTPVASTSTRRTGRSGRARGPRPSSRPRHDLRSWIPLVLAGLAITVIHHVTTFVLVGLLAGWLVIHLLRGRSDRYGLGPIAATTLLVGAATGLWLVTVGPTVLPYLGGPLNEAFGEVVTLVTAGQGRALFQSASGAIAPLWERLTGLGMAGLFLASVPIGLIPLLSRLRDRSLALTLGLLSLGYPASLVARLTPTGSEAAGRSLAFVFLGLAFVSGLAVVWLTEVVASNGATLPARMRGVVAPVARRGHRAWNAILAVALALVIVGALVVGTAPETRFPGPYLVVADRRSIDNQSTDLALWTGQWLGPDAPIAGDRINRLLVGSLADANTIFYASTGVQTWEVFTSPTVGADLVARLRQAGIRYLIVDRRLSTALPVIPYYYEEEELYAGPHTAPLPASVLAKWDGVPGVSRVYDGGSIQVYDVGGLDGVR